MSTTATVVLHGFTGSAAAMAPLTSRLPGPVLALDLPGHGSGPVSNDPVDYTMSAAIAGVLDAAAHLERFTLVGYSMGGRVALHVALAHPDRVTALALIGARAGIDDPAERAERIAAEEALASRIESEGIEWFADFWASQPLFATQRSRLSSRAASRVAGPAAGLRSPGIGSQPEGHGGRSCRARWLPSRGAVYALRAHRRSRRRQVRRHRPPNGHSHLPGHRFVDT